MFDLFLGDLQRHLKILDVEITEINARIKESNDPDGDGHYDAGEYFIGAGFVAVQKYMLETFKFLKMDKNEALAAGPKTAGPKIAGDVIFANAVWAAANFWKHEAEWYESGFEFGAQDSKGMHEVEICWPKNKKGELTENAKYLKEFGRFGNDYICANVLAAVIDDLEFRMQSALPSLDAWRIDIERKVEARNSR